MAQLTLKTSAFDCGCWCLFRQVSRDQNPLVGNPLAIGGKEVAVSKRVAFVSYRKQNRAACRAKSRRKLSWGSPRCHGKRRKRLSRKASAGSKTWVS